MKTEPSQPTVERDLFTCKERRFLKLSNFIWLVVLTVIGTGFYMISQKGIDYVWFKVRILMDGQAQQHNFSPKRNLAGKNFYSLNLSGSTFPQVNLQDANLEKTNLNNAIFNDCNLTGANLKEADLTHSYFLNCRLETAKLHFTDLSNANLEGSTLRFALLGNAKLENCNLKDVDLRGVSGLSTSELETALNWHLAKYDMATAKTIRMDFIAEDKVLPNLLTWEAWMQQQKKYNISEADSRGDNSPSG